MAKKQLDCLIVGGGPAGLTAAIYLARFHLSVRVVDGGKSRALSIPCTHNHAGFPGGISGSALLVRMREQAMKYGAVIEPGRVSRLETTADGFEAEWGQGAVHARTILLATGVSNRRPSIGEDLHDEAVAKGFIRYCPVCDGFEVTDRKVGVIGTSERGLNEAVFLRSFTADVTLIAPDGAHRFEPSDEEQAGVYGISLVSGPAHVARLQDGMILVETGDGAKAFDSIYPALGSDTNSDLAIAVRADTGEAGCLKVDHHQRTSIPGLYAAGDVVLGLDQIGHAMGEGGVAATTIRNDLAAKTPLLRERRLQSE